MASLKLMASLTSQNSDLRQQSSTSSSPRFDFGSNSHTPNDAGSTNLDANGLSINGISRNVYADESPEIGPIVPIGDGDMTEVETTPVRKKTVDEVWREIVERKRCKEEAMDEMDHLMTLEDFLVKAGAVDEAAVTMDVASNVTEVKVEAPTRLSGGIFAYDSPVVVSPLQSCGSSGAYMDVMGGGGGGGGGGGSIGRGKRRGNLIESLDKATEQRQKRMIKNRESAARSRERKQAYQTELEAMVVRLEEENERLYKEKAEWEKERLKQLMEKVIPFVEKPKLTRVLRRVQSAEW